VKDSSFFLVKGRQWLNSLCRNAQTRMKRYKLNPGLLQYLCFNFDVPYSQQVERAADIVLLPHTLRRVALDLRSNPGRHLYPLHRLAKLRRNPCKVTTERVMDG